VKGTVPGQGEDTHERAGMKIITGEKFIYERNNNMKRKSPIIQQGVVTELMSQLAKLPEREKAPGDPVRLSEIFRTKEYIAEIKGALKRGYSFDDLAKIFTERCEIAVSARQIRYHFTREMNRGKKTKVGKKNEGNRSTKKSALSANSPRKDAAQHEQESPEATDFEAKSGVKTFPKGTEKGTSFVSDNNAARDTKRETFSSEMALGQS
jgi:hypothetical protein